MIAFFKRDLASWGQGGKETIYFFVLFEYALIIYELCVCVGVSVCVGVLAIWVFILFYFFIYFILFYFTKIL